MKCCPYSFSRVTKLLVVVLFVACMVVAFHRARSVEPAARIFARTTEARSTGLSNSDAEFISNSQIKLDDNSHSEVTTSQPLLPDDRPDWVAQPDQIDGEVHRISIGTDLASSIDECQNKLDEALLNGVRRYVDEHLSENRKIGSSLTDLNAAWIRSYLLDSDHQYDATLTRPAGTYHQIWVQLRIDPEARETIRQWIQRAETKWRAGVVGVVGGGFVVCLSLLNTGLRLFAKKR